MENYKCARCGKENAWFDEYAAILCDECWDKFDLILDFLFGEQAGKCVKCGDNIPTTCPGCRGTG